MYSSLTVGGNFFFEKLDKFKRFRAILERIAEKTVWNYDYQHPQEMDETAAANMFITDQYSDNTLPAWAFRFNFDQWTKDYNITQVRSFCVPTSAGNPLPAQYLASF